MLYIQCNCLLSAPGKLKNMPGNRQLSKELSNRAGRIAQLAERWASIPKVVASISFVVRHIFQLARFEYKTQCGTLLKHNRSLEDGKFYGMGRHHDTAKRLMQHFILFYYFMQLHHKGMGIPQQAL